MISMRHDIIVLIKQFYEMWEKPNHHNNQLGRTKTHERSDNSPSGLFKPFHLELKLKQEVVL